MIDTLISQVYLRSICENPLEQYASLLTVYAYARYGIIKEDTTIINNIKKRLNPFIQGDIPLNRIVGNYITYEAGGNGAAYLWYKGKYEEAQPALDKACSSLLSEHPRDRKGIFSMPHKTNKEHVWIDTVYGVTPFLTWLGLKNNDSTLIKEGHDQMRKAFDLLLDSSCGLLHQARDFNGPGIFSMDHWSRGNGWGFLALADAIDALPIENEYFHSYAQMLKDLMKASLVFQDDWGMWHQEITDHSSYPETSGTGLILYALGRGINKGIFRGDQYQNALLKGIAGLIRYISPDGSIHNRCRGCLAPGKGQISDYTSREWILNDPHAFGPVILALSEGYFAHIPWNELINFEFPRGEKKGNIHVSLS